jgi:hypothetical protein
MDPLARAFLIVGNVAVIAVLVGIAHVVGWAGPSYAAGVLTGVSVFFCWYKLRNGRWPD